MPRCCYLGRGSSVAEAFGFEVGGVGVGEVSDMFVE